MTEPTTDPGTRRGDHRRTWEIELLISGAIVVALFKLPGAVDGLYESLKPHISRDLHTILWSLYWPVKLVVTPTLVVFVGHILLRGLWVGLVGLNAVYPRGIDWERTNLGPILNAWLRPRLDTRALEARVDHVASLLFAVLFGILGIFTAMGGWIAASQVAVLVAASFGWTSGPISRPGMTAYFGALALVGGPLMLSGLLDKLAESRPRLAERRWYAAVVRGLFRFSWVALLMPAWYGLTIALQSNLVRRKPSSARAMAFGLGLGILIAVVVLGPLIGARLLDGVDSYVYAPLRPQESGVESIHYRSMATATASAAVPTIQTDQVTDPFLRLELPYDAWRDNQRLAEVCPEVEPFRRDGDLAALLGSRSSTEPRRRQVLGCFAHLWTAELDGEAVELDLLFTDDPGGRGRGLAAYLPIADLSGGRHDLVLTRRASEAEREGRRYDPERNRFFIPFWKG